jgi:hypothetical protein
MGLFVNDAKADVSNPFNGLTNFDLTFTRPPSSFFSSSTSSSSFFSSSSSSSDGSSSSSPLQFEPQLQHTSSHHQHLQHLQHFQQLQHQHQQAPTQATSAAAAAVMNDSIGGQAKRQRASALVDSAEAQAQAQAGRVDGGLVGPLVSLLVEQVREVKRENASLRDELTQLTTHRVRALEDDNRRLHAELLRLRSIVDDLQSQRNNHQPPNSRLQLYLNPAFISSSSPSPPSPSSFFNPSLSSSSSLLSPSFLSPSDLGPLSARGAGGGWAPNRGGRPTWAGLLGMPAFRPLAKRALPFLDDYAGELATRPCVFDDVLYAPRHIAHITRIPRLHRVCRVCRVCAAAMTSTRCLT